MRRISSLSNLAGVAIDRETDSKYDNIKKVAEQLDDISALVVIDPNDSNNIVINPNISAVAGMSIDVDSLKSANIVLQNLSAEVANLGIGEKATVSYNNTTGVITIGVPDVENGKDGFTPSLSLDYDSSNDELSYTVSIDGDDTTTILDLNLRTAVTTNVESIAKTTAKDTAETVVNTYLDPDTTDGAHSIVTSTAIDAVNTYLDSSTSNGAHSIISDYMDTNPDNFKGLQGDPGTNGKTPIYEFKYNEATGDVDYALVNEVSYKVQEWD